MLCGSKASAATVKAPTTTGLVGHWKFDEGSGLIAVDSSGNKNTGTLSGATKPIYVAGKIGPTALSFDGSSGYVDVGNKSSLIMNSNSFTVAYWLKSTVKGRYIIRGGDTGSRYYDVLDGTIGQLVARIYDGTNFSSLLISNQALNDGRWHHIVWETDRSVNLMKMWVDGVKQTSEVDISGIGSIPSMDQFYIGKAGTSYYNGLIDDVRIYNRAISATEIKQLYNIGR